MSLAGALVGGAVGTLVLTSGMRVAQEIGWTRMDIPLVLGTMFTPRRRAAAIIGYAVHLANGFLFALVYYGIFSAAGHAGWLFGLALGGLQAAFVGSAGLNVLLPTIHPRMGTPWTNSRETPLLEPPGFLLVNYGPVTAIVTLVLHLAYGAIVGAFAAGL
jgi:hypothetical protein